MAKEIRVCNIEWESGSLNETAIKKFKELGIDWRYSHFFELEADLFGVGLWFPIEFHRLSGDTWEVVGLK